jgi:alkylhydroperoxidase family enzyme
VTHAAVAAEAIANEPENLTATLAHLNAVLSDWRTAPLDPRVKAALQFLEKLTLTPDEISPADATVARAAGVSDSALREVIYVCFLLSTMDRLADAFDFPVLEPRSLHRSARIAVRWGYRGLSV